MSEEKSSLSSSSSLLLDEGKDDESGLDPILERLFAYCTADEFNDILEEFCTEHASKFESAKKYMKNNNGEHKLSWMHIYKEYNVLMEFHLGILSL